MIEPIQNIVRSLTGGNPLLFHATMGLIIALTVIGCGKVVKWLLAVVGKRIIAKTETDLDDEILAIISSRLIALSSVTGIYFGMKELRRGLTKDHAFFLQFLEYADTALYLLTVVIIASVVIRIARTLTTHGIKAVSDRSRHEQLSLTLAPLANRIISIVIIALTAIIVLEHFGQSVTSLVTILGAGSLALGLAAQDTISNMISGFIIMIDRPFRVGDRVKIPSGETGDVFEIGLRSTKILDFDNNVLIVPNNELVKTKIVNFGYPDTEVRVNVEVTVAYGTDVQRMKRILLDLAATHPHVLKDPAPEAYLMKLGDYGLHFALHCRVAEFKQQFPAAEAIRVSLYQELTRQRIEIPYPHHVVHNTYDSTETVRNPRTGKKVQR
ncbi:MAG: mechanosensitive ion channel family protein [Bacteroidetes bacterium]|nr:mechanosensitive ion channel family protein [Bacteroidota bacterium]